MNYLALFLSVVALSTSTSSCSFSFSSSDSDHKGVCKSCKAVTMSGVDSTVVYGDIKADYESIDVSGVFRVRYSDTVSSVTLKADRSLIPYIRICPDGDELEISIRLNSGKGIRTPEVLIPVSSRSIRSIDMSGATSFVSDVVMQGSELSLDLSGASKVKMDVKVGILEVDVSGAGKLELAGEAEHARIDCSGAAVIKGRDEACLKAGSAELDCSGAVKIEDLSGGRLYGELSGASRLKVSNGSDISGISCYGASKVTVKSN